MKTQWAQSAEILMERLRMWKLYSSQVALPFEGNKKKQMKKNTRKEKEIIEC